MFSVLGGLKNGAKVLTLTGAVLSLLACGGGGGGDSVDTVSTNAPEATPVVITPEQPAPIIEAPIVQNAGQEAVQDVGQESGQDVIQDNDPSGPVVVPQPEAIAPVVVVAQPQSTTVNGGESAQFSVAANGGGSLSFQWRKNGAVIAGATSSSLVIDAVGVSDVGSYDVTVSNSVSSVSSLAALLLVVDGQQEPEVVVEQPIVPVVVELSWDIPLQREDGSDLALYEINGYTIAYGTSPDNLDGVIEVVGGGKTSVVVEDLVAPTYYFAIATVDSDGVQGAYSEIITQTIL